MLLLKTVCCVFVQCKKIYAIFCFMFRYAWSIAKCLKCHRHMGWKFTATNKKLKPKEFWGLCRGSLSVHFGGVNSDEHSLLVF